MAVVLLSNRANEFGIVQITGSKEEPDVEVGPHALLTIPPQHSAWCFSAKTVHFGMARGGGIAAR